MTEPTRKMTVEDVLRVKAILDANCIDDSEDRKRIEQDRLRFGTAMWEEREDGSIRHIELDSDEGRAIAAAHKGAGR
jgi:hypothetical protein